MDKLELSIDKNDILFKMRVSRCQEKYNDVIEIYNSRGVLFRDDIWISDEYCIALYYLDRITEAYEVYERVIARSRDLKIDDLKHLASNNWFSVCKLNQISNQINKNILHPSREIKFSKYNIVTLTMTTCKRLDLFMRTVDSLISKCEDIDLISRWVVVDDGSSSEDIETMRSRYPFIEFVVKHECDKGHARSMNIILDTLNTPFVFHVEDDWEFVYQRRYVTECLDVLASSNILGQCLVNMNYAETENDFKIHGGTVKKTLGGANYIEHTYIEGGSGCTYWPHFSLRPGMSRVEALKRVGRFSEKVAAFEHEYASRYMRMGYRTAFLPNINSMHIGRLTSERHLAHVGLKNAYDLNLTVQFADVFCRIINLKRRCDRKTKFETNILPKISFLNPEFYTAVDANDLEPLTEQQEKMFANNNFGWRKTLIACSLSHLGVITEFLNSSSSNLCIVFEDDVLDVSDTIAQYINLISASDYDIVYLGHHPYDLDDTDKSNSSKTISIVRMNVFESLKYSMGGCFGYVLSRRGAERFLEYVSRNGIKYGIDTTQQHACDELKIGYCVPMCVRSECYRNGVFVDSDIQYDFTIMSHN